VDLELTQALLIRCYCGVNATDTSATAIMLAVEREVVLEHKHGEFPGGYGEGSEYTVTSANVPVHVVAGGTRVQANGMGAPPMPWPTGPAA